MATRPARTAHENRLLEAVGAENLAGLVPHLRAVELERGHLLSDAGQTMRHVYFPCDGNVISLMAVMRDGAVAETATVGREGAVGLIAGMCSHKSFNRCIVQMTGTAYQVEAARLTAEIERNERLRHVLNCFTEALLSQVMQSVACNALHAVEARLCRFFLMMHDRFDSDVLPLTQEFLAEMLGVQRSTVSLAARAVQAAGLIRYRRGAIEIVDRDGLEEATCECYAIVRGRYQELLAPPS